MLRVPLVLYKTQLRAGGVQCKRFRVNRVRLNGERVDQTLHFSMKTDDRIQFFGRLLILEHVIHRSFVSIGMHRVGTINEQQKQPYRHT